MSGVPNIRESKAGFPSSGLVTILYCVGALSGLICAFLPMLGPLQTTNCLLISWILALGALASSIFTERPGEQEDDLDY